MKRTGGGGREGKKKEEGREAKKKKKECPNFFLAARPGPLPGLSSLTRPVVQSSFPARSGEAGGKGVSGLRGQSPCPLQQKSGAGQGPSQLCQLRISFPNASHQTELPYEGVCSIMRALYLPARLYAVFTKMRTGFQVTLLPAKNSFVDMP